MLANCIASYVPSFPWVAVLCAPSCPSVPMGAHAPPYTQLSRSEAGCGVPGAMTVAPGDPVAYLGDLRFALKWKLTVTLLCHHGITHI